MRRLNGKFSMPTPFLPPEMWESIFNCLDDGSDFNTVINSCPIYHDLLAYKKTSRLFSEVLPILLNTVPEFSLKSMLDLRLVNSEWRRQVDNILITNPRHFVAPNYSFEDVEHVESFMNHADRMPGINPFLGKFLRAWPSNQPCLNAVIHLVEKYGRNLKTVSLLSILEAHLTPQLLNHLLVHLANVQNLTLVAKLEFGQSPTIVNLPPLTKLTAIDLSGLMSDELSFNTHLQSLTTSIIQAYGLNLTSLGCSKNLLKIEGLCQFTPNLKKLIAYSFTEEDFQVLTRVGWRLESICFRGDIIIPRLDFVSALNNFKATLVSLEFPVLLEENFNFAPLQVFSKLTEVYVSVDSFSITRSVDIKRFWNLALACPNLEQLSIRLVSPTLTKSIVNPVVIFQMFRKLKSLNL